MNRSERLRGIVRALPHVWSVLLPVVLLGPALGAGYVLTYDMVFVPDMAMRSDFLGAGGGLPRAVPSDAVVALLDNVVPGMVLQHVLLLGALVLLAQGMLRLVGTSVMPGSSPSASPSGTRSSSSGSGSGTGRCCSAAPCCPG